MKKKIIRIFALLFILFAAATSVFLILTETVYIFDFSENKNICFYETAVAYIRENTKDAYYENEKDYQLFTSYNGFGSYSDANYTYVFLWLSTGSYYTKNGKLYSASGSNMPYKFTFKDNEVISYEIPMDGEAYVLSIKRWFPKSMRHLYQKLLDRDNHTNDEIEKQVKTYYSYLESTEIQYGTD